MSQKLLPMVADLVFNTPLLITQRKLDSIMAVIGPRIGLGGEPVLIDMENHQPEATMGQFSLSAGPDSNRSGDIVTLGLITVHGTLVHRARGMSGWSGLRSYESIREDFRELRADRTVQGIVFEYDSDGGSSAGLFDLVEELYQARGEIPMYAIINEACYSAAYALASAQDEIYVTRSGGAGSIGVRMRHVDRSKLNEMAGLTVTEIAIGDRKLDGSPDQPLSDKAREIFTDSATKTYDLFVATVARNRNLSEKAVRATQAAFYEGEDAVTAGLADAVLSYDAALQRVADNIATGGKSMSNTGLQNQFGALMKGAGKDDIKAALAAHGFVPQGEASGSGLTQADLDKAKDEAATVAKAEGKKEALDYAGQIIGLCGLARLPGLAAGIIKAGTSIDDARQQLVDAQAKDQGLSGGQEINSTVSATSTGKVSALVENAKQRADQQANQK